MWLQRSKTFLLQIEAIWNCQRNADTKQLADIHISANLRQHVQERTHKHGHILHLVISRDYDNLIKGVSSMLSDHLLINSNVFLQKQSVSAKVISYRQGSFSF